jgi:hypothetical protein
MAKNLNKQSLCHTLVGTLQYLAPELFSCEKYNNTGMLLCHKNLKISQLIIICFQLIIGVWVSSSMNVSQECDLSFQGSPPLIGISSDN